MRVPWALALLLAVPSRSAPPSCLAPGKPKPASLQELRGCQDHLRYQLSEQATANGKPLSEAQLDAIDERHRAEARRYLAEGGVVEHDAAAATKAPAAKKVKEGAPAAAPSAKGAKGEKLPASAKPGELGGLDADALSRASPDEAAALLDLQAKLQGAAGDGSAGVTPEMAAQIAELLRQRQGQVSPEMQALLDAAAKDGGKLTPETMKKLQDAGKAAEGEGMNLNIDPKMREALLETDFSQTPPKPGGS